MKRVLPIVIVFFAVLLTKAWAWQADNLDGTYKNPVLYADYPDPDIIRVGEDFYLVSTTFVDSPAINVLHSKDLVNWEFASHVAKAVDGGSAYNLVNGSSYRGGFWASSIRHRNGTFYVVVNPTFANARVYYTKDIRGTWSYYQLDRPAYDPGFFIDDDGTGYIACGGGIQSLITLSSDYSRVVSQKDNWVNSGGEGSHLVKKGAYYYLFNAKPSVWPFQLLCSRSHSLSGPWETNHECLNALTGGHQGAIVDLPDGSWYGFVHQDRGAIGRMTQICPVSWSDDWPVWGLAGSPGRVPNSAPKPIAGKPVMQPATSDDFNGPELGLQWQWNHNPDETKWSLAERPGFLRLHATPATSFWLARNTLTQKGQGPKSRGEVKMDLSGLSSGDVAGLGTLGKVNGRIFVSVDSTGKRTLGMGVDNRGVGSYEEPSLVSYEGTSVYLRVDLNFETGLGVGSYSSDGKAWHVLGAPFPLDYDITYGTFQGEKFALFCYGKEDLRGYVDIDSFTFSNDAPLTEVPARGRPTRKGNTFVGDNGQRLRGPFASTEWGDPPSLDAIKSIRALGCNAVHLYAESFDKNYPASGSTAPGYAATRVDQMVQRTKEAGLYLVITIGNGANNGAFNLNYVSDFWKFYAPRYRNETHVLFEIQNEPFAWGPPYSKATLDMESSVYTLIRSYAPDTPVLLFSFSVLSSGSDAVANIKTVSTAASVDWTKTAVAFHGYAGFAQTTAAVETITSAGYPCFMTEFTGPEWGTSGRDYLDVSMTSELERLGISWLSFLYIPPNFINSDVTKPAAFKDLVDKAGLSWVPDFGPWPVSRSPFGNGGNPWTTTKTRVANVLGGTLRFEAENFDQGGEGISYHDTSGNASNGGYRALETADVRSTADVGGGYEVTSASGGEWFEYTLQISEPGFYDLSVRSTGSGVVRGLFNGLDKTGEWTLPSAGASGAWSTSLTSVFLEPGRQKFRLEVASGSLGLNWFELTPKDPGLVKAGTYRLVNRATGLALTANSTRGSVDLGDSSSASLQLWKFDEMGAGQFRVSSSASSRNWSVFYTRNGDGLDLVGWWTVESTSQRFLVKATGEGFCRMIPVSGGLSVSSGSVSAKTGTQAVQEEYTGLATQQWAFLDTADLLFPTGLRAEKTAQGQRQLTWTSVSGADGYTVWRSTNADKGFSAIAQNVKTASYLDGTPDSTGTFYYCVSATSAKGESLKSAVAYAPGLVALLPFDEVDSGVTPDVAGNGWNGTLLGGATLASGKFGSSVTLNGTEGYVSLPSGLVETLPRCTIALWVNLERSDVWSRIFDFGMGTGKYVFLTPRNGITGVLRCAINAGSGEQVIDGKVPLATGSWVHLAVTMGDGLGVLYVDGKEVGRNAAFNALPPALGHTVNNYLGKSQFALDPYLKGKLDDFRIYGAVLDPAAIAALASLVPETSPTITTQPKASNGVASEGLLLSVEAQGASSLSYQWQLNGVDIAGATLATYEIRSLQMFHAGDYRVVVTSAGGGRTVSDVAHVDVSTPPTTAGRVSNISTRAFCGSGDRTLIPGFYVSGQGTKPLLIRAVGPTLEAFSIANRLGNPRMFVKKFDENLALFTDVVGVDDWGATGDTATLASVTAALGAFALPEGSLDASVLIDASQGRYSVVCDDKEGGSGVAIVEVYDGGHGADSSQLSNLATRGFVGKGENVMIGGIVVSPEGPQTLLIRAVGPGLKPFGVAEALLDPRVDINDGTSYILSNNDWEDFGGGVEASTVASHVGAFALTPGSKDSAFVVTLRPGNYTLAVRGNDDGEGVALLEVYVVR